MGILAETHRDDLEILNRVIHDTLDAFGAYSRSRLDGKMGCELNEDELAAISEALL